jgi:hypothetical protein
VRPTVSLPCLSTAPTRQSSLLIPNRPAHRTTPIRYHKPSGFPRLRSRQSRLQALLLVAAPRPYSTCLLAPAWSLARLCRRPFAPPLAVAARHRHFHSDKPLGDNASPRSMHPATRAALDRPICARHVCPTQCTHWQPRRPPCANFLPTTPPT